MNKMILALNSENDEEQFKKAGIPTLKHYVGCWKGHLELSYLVDSTIDAYKLADENNQESLLVLYPEDNSLHLVYLNGYGMEKIGTFKNVGKMQPEEPNWTYEIETGDYFIGVN